MSTVYVVEDSMGFICMCATEELAKKYADHYWCNYLYAEVIDENWTDPDGDTPKIHDVRMEEARKRQ